MPRSPAQLRTDAFAIWFAAVEAVRSDRLVREQVQVKDHWLRIGEETLDLREVRRLVVVGGGKAGAGMAAGWEDAIGEKVARDKQMTGLLNVPADCVRPLQFLKLHAARPAGVNEPTEAGVQGTAKILELVSGLGPDDVVVCLLSGGGSALLPAPVPGISLADKQAVTRFLSGAGANIAELNTVRKQLSRIKGGGLARACRAGRLITLIISDVLGDPLDIIASGPTVSNSTTAADAWDVLQRFGAPAAGIAPAVTALLQQQAKSPPPAADDFAHVTNVVIGNNAIAVDAAGIEAERRGYSHAMLAARTLEGPAEAIGRHHAEMARQMRDEPGPDCLITGGEPTVKLAPAEIRGRGGRNQQLVLAATETLGLVGWEGKVLLAGGTDGEDGPTDAAGAYLDAATAARAIELGLDPASFLRRSDAYHFFAPLDALVTTGPTHTNVCDVRVVVVDRIASAGE